VAAELLGTLAFAADQALLALAVEAVRGLATAIVATRDVDVAAARLGPGDAAPRWVGTLALLAFALFALRLVATRIVALRPQEATRVPAGLASRRLRSLCLLALRFVAGALLGVAHCLHTLGLLTLRLRTFRHFR